MTGMRKRPMRARLSSDRALQNAPKYSSWSAIDKIVKSNEACSRRRQHPGRALEESDHRVGVEHESHSKTSRSGRDWEGGNSSVAATKSSSTRPTSDSSHDQSWESGSKMNFSSPPPMPTSSVSNRNCFG